MERLRSIWVPVALILFCFLANAWIPVSASAEVKFSPVAQASLSGDLTWVDGGDKNFRGNADVRFVPVVELSPRMSILPTLHGSYSGNQSAVRIADEGALFQQQIEYQGELALLRQLTPTWRGTLRAGYANDLLKETKDETKWGNGLYDHRTVYFNVGLAKELRDARLPSQFRMGVEHSQITFPNFTTLASQQGLGFPGARELDAFSLSSYFRGESFFGPKTVVEYGLSLGQDYYRDQFTIVGVGQISDSKRRDQVISANGRWSRLGQGARLPTDISLGFDFRRRTSNQSAYDAFTLRYLKDYYNYDEFSLSPGLLTKWVRTGVTGFVGLTATRRSYPSRPSQDEVGNYQNNNVFSNSFGWTLRFTRPLRRGIQGMVSTTWNRVTSNNTYKGVYNYNYKSESVLIGISAEY